MKLPTTELGQLKHVEFRNRSTIERSFITGVSTDSRTLKRGNLFVALKGDHYDGHAFIEQAFARGAVAAIVGTSEYSSAWESFPLLIVEDPVGALGALAGLYRMRFTLPVIAVGGSNGKTTTKEMIARVLRQRYNVLSTEGNLNNQIGVPHTLFRLENKHEVAVVEVGTNHPGEIAYLCGILQPTHGVITNIGKEHLEYFKGIEGVALEEGSLFASLRMRKGGVAFVNLDDAIVVAQAKGMRGKCTYGMTRRRADLHGTVLGFDRAGCAKLRIKAQERATSLTMQLRVPGETNASNALAAAAVGIHFRVPPKYVGKALESFTAASNRMEVVRIDGITVLNDTYNANPDSTLAALRVLARAAARGKKVAVLADMLELGTHAADEHARVGREATELCVDYLLTYGTLARHIHDAAGVQYRMHYENKNVLAEYLAELVTRGDLVLVKGSRGMKMEDVVTFLRERLRARGSGEG